MHTHTHTHTIPYLPLHPHTPLLSHTCSPSSSSFHSPPPFLLHHFLSFPKSLVGFLLLALIFSVSAASTGRLWKVFLFYVQMSLNIIYSITTLTPKLNYCFLNIIYYHKPIKKNDLCVFTYLTMKQILVYLFCPKITNFPPKGFVSFFNFSNVIL